jgi:uncharacterized protein DUF3817
MRTLRIAATAEAATLAFLLANLLTTHTEAISALIGPLHGMAYLAVIAATPRAARWHATIPGIGGLLALRRMHNAGSPLPHTDPPAPPTARDR